MLPPPSALLVFVLAALALLVAPGPAVLFIVARSVDQGPRAGIVSTLGIATGTLFHVAAAALGVSALLISSAAAFQVVKYAGAAYLVWLGVRRWLAPEGGGTTAGSRPRALGRLFREGVLVNLLNPKTALFFFALLPQFVDPARGHAGAQVIFLGTLFVGLGVLSDGIWALLAGTVGHRLRRRPWFVRWQGRVTGGTFVALGLAAALSGQGRK